MVRRKKCRNADITELFESMKNLRIPDDMEKPPPIKTWEEVQSDAEIFKQKQMEQRKKRYEAFLTDKMKFVTDAEFMRRDNTTRKEEDVTTPVDIIQESENSYQTDANSMELFVEEDVPLSAYDRLYIPREKCGWTRAVLAQFKKANKMLERFMDNRNMPRIANATKRIAKAESVNLRLKRYCADEIKKRLEHGEVDLFGYFNLVPHTLIKTSETAIERKRKLINRFHDLMFDFDYADRPGQRERVAEYEDNLKIAKRLEEITSILAEYGKTKSTKPTSRKRKRVKEWEEDFDRMADSWISKSEEFVRREENLIVEDVLKANAYKAEIEAKKQAEKEEKRKIVEMKRIKKHENEMKKRRLELEEREREQKELAIKMEEELRKKQEAERVEQERLKKERQWFEEEQKRRDEEEFKLAQETIEARFREEQKRIEEEKARRDNEALERLKRSIAAIQKDVEKDIAGSSAPPKPQNKLDETPLIEKPWNFMKVSLPDNWEKRKDKFRTRFDIPGRVEERQLELYEAISKYNVKTGPVVISPENKKTTLVKLMLPPEPKKAIIPQNQPATDVEVKSTLGTLDEMLKTRKHVALQLSLNEREIDYQTINLHDLKTTLVYPFRQSDGMYWPVIYTLPGVIDDSTREHVEAYTKCNSFSGKYASYLLLTTAPVEDENQDKKFDDDFQDSDGDWADYSKKPGRFSNRIGFKAKGGSTEDFEVQRERAVAVYRQDFERQTRDMDEFERHREEFLQDRDGARYRTHLTTHLRELVRDARLDVYSIKETFDGCDGVVDHPGTRDSPLDPRWHNHGYNRYVKTRDDAFGDYMYDITKNYEYELPPVEEKKEFEDWCFTPMLASIYYQAYYDTFHVLTKEEMNSLESRRKLYIQILESKRFDLKKAESVCSMTDSDKKQWTFLLDQLVSHFREFPAVFHLMFKSDCELHACAQKAIDQVMKTTHKKHSNHWFLEEI